MYFSVLQHKINLMYNQSVLMELCIKMDFQAESLDISQPFGPPAPDNSNSFYM
jgi:hypothetical protein